MPGIILLKIIKLKTRNLIIYFIRKIIPPKAKTALK